MNIIFIISGVLFVICLLLCIVTLRWRIDANILCEKEIELAKKNDEIISKNILIEELKKNKIENDVKLSQLEILEAKFSNLNFIHSELEKNHVALEEKFKQEEEKRKENIAFIKTAEQTLSNAFKAISSEVFSKNSESFLTLAKNTFENLHEKTKSEMAANQKSVSEIVNPIKNALENVDIKLKELEHARIEAYTDIKTQMSSMILAENNLRSETNRLASALKSPNTRGRWGEIQLRRVAELAGMTSHCDFLEQVQSETDDGKVRPDMIIYIPGNRQIIVDAKAPISAFLESLETNNEPERIACLQRHAKLIRTQISKLSNKKYWESYAPCPEFVILYLPGEGFLTSALEQDPGIIDFGLQEHIIITTPSTLFAALQVICLSWKQDSMTEQAQKIIETGKELYKRLSVMSSHFADLGKSLNSSVNKYNDAMGSLERNVFSSVRKIKDLEMHGRSLPEIPNIDAHARSPKISP